MKSYFLPCPICLSHHHEVLFPGFHNVGAASKIDDFQNIVICIDCGAVFRNPIVPELNVTHYNLGPRSWGDEDDQKRFDERLTYVSRIVADAAKLRPGDLIIDIGGGPGWLIRRLTELAPGVRAVLCEPGIESARFAKENMPGLIAVPARIDELETARTHSIWLPPRASITSS